MLFIIGYAKDFPPLRKRGKYIMNIFKKTTLFFSLLLFSTFTVSTHAMEEEKRENKSVVVKPVVVRSGKELSDLVKAGKGHLVARVEVPRGDPTETEIRFKIDDIKACTHLKELSIGNTVHLYDKDNQKKALFDETEHLNTKIIKELARGAPPSLTTLEIGRTPNFLSGGANDENLQIFGKRAPGITHLTIDACGLTIDTCGQAKELALTDEALVNFQHLKSLVLVDAPHIKGDKLKNVNITRITHEGFRIMRIINPGFDKNAKTILPKEWKLTDQEQGRTGNPSYLRKKPTGIEILGDDYTFYSKVPDLNNFNKKTFLFNVTLRGTKPGVVIQYWDGKNPITSDPYKSKIGEWETLSIEFTVDTQKAQFHRLYAAILGSQKNSDIDIPSVEVIDVALQQK